MKLTKNCLYPWSFLQVHAGGMMQCCAVGNDCDLGDFIIDYCQKEARGEPAEVLNSPGLVRLRQSLLDGDLRPMCRKCFFADERLITTEELQAKVRQLLKKRLPSGTDVDSLNFARSYAYKEMAIAFTNKCNQRCVYCVQSTQARTNPYYTMDFPEEYALGTLDFFAACGVDQIRTCVEGEPTIYPHWCEVFSAFKAKYPHIDLYMTTNLSRRYADEEITLLARYKVLDVSCDTLDPKLYARLRRGGKLGLVLENIRRVQTRVKEFGIPGPRISLHAVVSDRTWPTLPEFVDYAFANGLVPLLGNYEERGNALAFQKQLCRPITTLPLEEQAKARDFIVSVRDRLTAQGRDVTEFIQGGLLYTLEQNSARNRNRFSPYDENPLHRAFYTDFPLGEDGMHLDIAHDYDNTAYAGVLFAAPGKTLRLQGVAAEHAVLREVFVYRSGCASVKYGQTVLPGYRRTVAIKDGMFEYSPPFTQDVAMILLECSEWW